MARYRGTVFAVLLALLLGGYIYFVEQGSLSTDEQQAGDELLIPHHESNDARSIALWTASGAWAARQDTGGAWQLTAPVTDKAEATTLSSMIDIPLTQKSVRHFSLTAGDDLASYGLAQPAAVLTIGFSNGRSAVVQIGSSEPLGTGYYARLAGSLVIHVMSGNRADLVITDVSQLRRRALLDAAQLYRSNRIELVANSGALRFEERNGHWRVTQPCELIGDRQRITAIIGELTQLPIKAWVGQDSSFSDCGLDLPAYSITLDQGDTHIVTVNFGNRAGTDTVYAYTDARPAIVTVDSRILSLLSAQPEDYGSKMISPFHPYEVDAVTVTPAGGAGRRVYREGMNWVGLPEDTADAAVGALTGFPFTDYRLLTAAEAPQPLADASSTLLIETRDGTTMTVYLWQDAERILVWREGEQAVGLVTPATTLRGVLAPFISPSPS